MKHILITGANFKNKGAQSMLFTLADAIRKMDSECRISFTSAESCDMSEYTFDHVFYSRRSRKIVLRKHPVFYMLEAACADTAKCILRRKEVLWHAADLRKIMPTVDLMIDVSGFALGDKWSVKIQERFLDSIRIAKKYQIPIIFMPQSFGPFDYEPDKSFLLQEIKELLPYADLIYAREKEGYQCLKEKFGLNNVRLSTDLVLQSEKIDTVNIYRTQPSVSVPRILPDSVGLVPNKKCFTYGSESDILDRYRLIIDELLLSGKYVCIFRHSAEDGEVCSRIYEPYADNPQVRLLTEDFSCLEYDELVKQFQFMVCSRYHSIVHAYRNAVPCVILGWAVKYQELAQLMRQEQYVFNIADTKSDTEACRRMVQNMLQDYEGESVIIKQRVSEVQKDNCFACLKNYL
ncbi:MAG: polysaccharide pyruvyl transferase family protein [Lachnospiraceae bacterium]|nr:polysaccharide pyruvyl transferase family protein [Lachnospiraceae bacterium]